MLWVRIKIFALTFFLYSYVQTCVYHVDIVARGHRWLKNFEWTDLKNPKSRLFGQSYPKWERGVIEQVRSGSDLLSDSDVFFISRRSDPNVRNKEMRICNDKFKGFTSAKQKGFIIRLYTLRNIKHQQFCKLFNKIQLFLLYRKFEKGFKGPNKQQNWFPDTNKKIDPLEKAFLFFYSLKV